MRIAIKYDDIDISSGGRVAGHEAGDTLVRRLLRIFPESIVIAPVPRQSEDFDVVPLEGLDPTSRRAAVRALGTLHGRALVCGTGTEAAVALGERTAIVVEGLLTSNRKMEGRLKADWFAAAS